MAAVGLGREEHLVAAGKAISLVLSINEPRNSPLTCRLYNFSSRLIFPLDQVSIT